MVDDGTTSFYRVRIRFAAGDGWSRWHRSSAASLNYANYDDAEEAALGCWRTRDSDGEWRKEYQVQVVEVRMSIEPVARVEPPHAFRMRDL
jgi:hypothetical protein